MKLTLTVELEQDEYDNANPPPPVDDVARVLAAQLEAEPLFVGDRDEWLFNVTVIDGPRELGPGTVRPVFDQLAEP